MIDSEYLENLKNATIEAEGQPGSSRLKDGNVEPPLDIFLSHLADQALMRDLLRVPNEWGHPALIEQLERMYSLKPQGSVPSNIVVTAGSTPAYSFACQVILRGGAGSRVLIETPLYQPLARIPQRLGANVDIMLTRSLEQSYRVETQLIGRSMTSDTALVVLTNLHNPSGAFIDIESLLQIKEAVTSINPRAKILIDETLHGFIRQEHPSAISIPGDSFIVISGLSKVYGLSLLRCGWIIASEEIIKLVRQEWLDHDNIGSRLTEGLASVVLKNLDLYDNYWRTRLAANRPLVTSFLGRMQQTGLLEAYIPEHGCICFPRVVRGKVADLVDRLKKEKRVFLSSGAEFRQQDHIRIGFGGPTDQVERGLEQLEEVLTQDKF